MTKTVALGEICLFYVGRPPPREVKEYFGGDILWLTPTEIVKDRIGAVSTSRETLSQKGFANSSAKLLPVGSVLMTSRASIGNIAISEKPVTTNQGFINFVCSPNIQNKYLAYWLLTNKSQFENAANGATFKEISRTTIKGFKIPLPSLPRQRQIAAILDRADALRQKDRQLLAHYDKLAQSTFMDLFGDPVRNEKGWDRVKIRDLVIDVKYGTSKPAEEKGAFPYLRMNNITYEGHWNFADLKFINLTKSEESKYLLKKGDIVFNRTNSRELVGKTAVYQRHDKMAIAGYLIRSRTNEKAVPEYISAYLNSKHGKATLQGMCKNIIGMANINAQEFQDIDILFPPLPLQTRFATIIEGIERQKAVVRQQMAASENLFQRLLQDAFGT